jgi:hypothetical protein
MSRLRQLLGMDLFDLIIHLGVTSALLGFVGVSGGPEELYPLMVGGSLLVLGVRRHFALKADERKGISTGEMAAERIAELEQRMADLESAQARVAELEERLDFAERLLAQTPPEHRQIASGGPP